MDSKEFPTLEDVHVILSDLTNLFEDRNAMLHTMMKEDKYKDFLLAENIQSMIEADNRDDSRKGGIKQDLANGYEILKAQTTMRKFANFINPASLPIMDLDAPIDLDDGMDEEDEEEDRDEQVDKASEAARYPDRVRSGRKRPPLILANVATRWRRGLAMVSRE